MPFKSLLQPWGSEEKNQYPIKKALVLNLMSSFVMVYFVSEYVRKIFSGNVQFLFNELIGIEKLPILSSYSWLSHLIVFILLYILTYVILHQLFCKRKNPYFKQVSLIWIVYSLLCLKDTWIELFLHDTWIAPKPIGGLEVSSLVLFIPFIMAILCEYYYTSDTAPFFATHKTVLSATDRLRKKVATILMSLGGINLILATFHGFHPSINMLWIITLISLILFLLLLVVDHLLSGGETFHALFIGGDSNEKIF